MVHLLPVRAQEQRPKPLLDRPPIYTALTEDCVLDVPPSTDPSADKSVVRITNRAGKVFFTVDRVSSASELALAMHLKEIDAVMYSAFWCPYCHEQQQRFGVEALGFLNIVECAEEGIESQTDLCQRKFQLAEQETGKQAGFPTWEINGKFYFGMQSLEELAEISGYGGPQDFQPPPLKPKNKPGPRLEELFTPTQPPQTVLRDRIKEIR